MIRKRVFLGLLLGVLSFSLVSNTAQSVESSSAIRVVVSIPPLYMLVSEIMKGVGTPSLILNKSSCPHDSVLKPSERAQLSKADLIFWIGKDFEQGIWKFIKTVSHKVKVVSFLHEKSLIVHKVQNSGHGHTHAHHTPSHKRHKETSSTVDPHIWLNTGNAEAMVTLIKNYLVEVDPHHEQIYEANEARLLKSIKKTSKKLSQQIKRSKNIPFAVFHNAYQYFFDEFGLGKPYTLTLHAGQSLTVGRLNELMTQIKQKNIKCLFASSSFSNKTLKTIGRSTNVRVILLNSLGNKGISYVELLENLGQSVVGCLN